jgi:hypothetical protein
MNRFHRRLQVVEERAATVVRLQAREKPATEQWLNILKAVLPILERAETTQQADAAINRVKHSITLLEEYAANAPHEQPWVYLEYYCHACVLRMGWTGFVPAFLDPDYDQQLREVMGIEHSRHGPPHSLPCD